MGHDQITPEWIEEMRKVCNAATPGPWESKHYGRYEDHDECCIALTDDSIEPLKYENADFIAAARTALPAALDALEAETKENERLKDSLGRHVQAEIGVSMSLSEFFPDHGEDHERIIIAAAKASAEIVRLTVERDAAVRDIIPMCQNCKHCKRPGIATIRCAVGRNLEAISPEVNFYGMLLDDCQCDMWVWRGPCTENTAESEADHAE